MSVNAEIIQFFVNYIKNEIGIIYSPEVYFQLEQRLEKVAEHLSLEGPEEVYKKAITEGIAGDFKQFILDISTNNETLFFRDPKVFQSIEDLILPGLRQQNPNKTIFRIWCCAASFGQEPYSIAMLVHEFLKRNPGHPKIEIVATDISEFALKRCQEASYSELEIQRGLNPKRMQEYFKKSDLDDKWHLNSVIKNLVEFRKVNLLDSFQSLGRFNLILCRYVLIYQDIEKKKLIIDKLADCLEPKGLLTLGASEGAFGLSDKLEQETLGESIFYRTT